jgi:hypothetical protein
VVAVVVLSFRPPAGPLNDITLPHICSPPKRILLLEKDSVSFGSKLKTRHSTVIEIQSFHFSVASPTTTATATTTTTTTSTYTTITTTNNTTITNTRY